MALKYFGIRICIILRIGVYPILLFNRKFYYTNFRPVFFVSSLGLAFTTFCLDFWYSRLLLFKYSSIQI